jgi:hypothetical protein
LARRVAPAPAPASSHTSLFRCASANFLKFSVSAASFMRRSSLDSDRRGSPAS